MDPLNLFRTCSQCSRCPLRDREKVPAQTPAESVPMLAIFGEAPGRDEDYWHQPFVGEAGAFLNWGLGESGIPRHLCHVSNVIHCRPPDNDINSPEGASAVGFCRGGLYEELRYLRDKKVTVILALGTTAMHAFGLEGAAHKYRGSVMIFDFLGYKFKVIPTFHPSHVMRNTWSRADGGKALGTVSWLADLRKAREVASGEWVELKEDFTLEPTIEQIEEFCREAVRTKKVVAVDIETTGLHYDFAKIVVVGLATSSSRGCSVPLLTKNENTPYLLEPENMFRLRKALDSVLSNCPLLFQNGFFDIPLLRRDGFNVPYSSILHDTILLHHTIASEAPHDLGYIVSIYGKTPYWKEPFKTKKSIFEMDKIEMRRYNLRDCVVLHQVVESMLKDLKEMELEKFYYGEVRPLIKPIMEMTRHGITCDMGAVAAFRRKLDKEIEKQRQHLLSSGGLPDCFSLDSDDNLRWFLYGKRPDKFDELADLPNKRKGTKVYDKLCVLQQIADSKPIYILESYSPRSTDTGKAGVSSEALLGYRIALNNRLEDIKAFVKKDGAEESAKIETLLTWLDDLEEYNALTKLCSTYTEYKPFKDGRIHPNWKTHGTVSGRLSCSKPNLQNLPKVDDDESPTIATKYGNEIRDFFRSAEGHVLISADYVNLEAALLAYETLEPDLLAVFSQGLNLHDINTRSLFRIDKDHPLWGEGRKASKVFFFGGISYGGGPRKVFENITIKAPKLRLTYSTFVQAQNNWFEDHRLYVAWKENLKNEIETTRYITTELGRGRVFVGNNKDILKQALDYKIQSPGASLINRAMVRIQERLEAEQLDAFFVLQIHDELILEASEKDAERAAIIQREEMERPFMFKGFERRIPVEQVIGKTLAELA